MGEPQAGETGAATPPPPGAWLTPDDLRPILGRVQDLAPLLGDADRWLHDLAGRCGTAAITLEMFQTAVDNYALKRPDTPGSPPDVILGTLAGFLGGAKVRRRRAEAPLNVAERAAMELWRKLWKRENQGLDYTPNQGDEAAMRAIVQRARERALQLPAGTRLEPILRHMFEGYLGIGDDRKVHADGYPLSLLLHRMSRIGEYHPPKRAAGAGAPAQAPAPAVASAPAATPPPTETRDGAANAAAARAAMAKIGIGPAPAADGARSPS